MTETNQILSSYGVVYIFRLNNISFIHESKHFPMKKETRWSRICGQTHSCHGGVCRPWRRAIIDNASCLWPRPDRFLHDLLLGFFNRKRPDGRTGIASRGCSTCRDYSRTCLPQTPPTRRSVSFLTPSATACGVDVRLYDALLSPPRDGRVPAPRREQPNVSEPRAR